MRERYLEPTDEIKLIQIKDKNEKLRFVIRRELIEKIINGINTRGIALDTIKWGITHNQESGTLYAGVHCGVGELYFSDKILNTNTIINLFSLDIIKIFEAGQTLEEIYHNNFEGFKYNFDVKKELDELYDQSFRKCKDCGGIVDNTYVEDEYLYDPGYEYRGVDSTERTAYMRCRDCNKGYTLHYSYAGEI